ncbi:hypothetical protein SPRG_02357 [Saprolegnia parasitica CBS 223.65]|uniref:KATNIP domain-containing protein n=1 Tax=Saprolegnia parasitica (strain CBS 223.65) TaxID=695850 RepID=A0A067D1N5_SAPPC|nr:hypothetical protein SPRG_02357 [Saprolegnia parasitica CBS 223.65]KDO32656.1 hypothetical protein SPRG_02357 [Saprolegnia parasitica CBS 223.65]|eukprot:XP_012196323.1 hypothetical protein SPRG_02357 [Saprolegnia parasitica CBS 223.65]
MADPRREKKWAKQATVPTFAAPPVAADTVATVATEKQLQYIRVLEERNRIKKKLEEQSRNDRDLEEKESGFSTNFNGENASRKPRAASAKPRAKSAAKLKSHGSTAELRPRAEPKRETKSTSALPLHSATDVAPRVKQKWAKPQGVVEQRDGRIVFVDPNDCTEDTSNQPLGASLEPPSASLEPPRAGLEPPSASLDLPRAGTQPCASTSDGNATLAMAIPVDAKPEPASASADEKSDDEAYLDESFEEFDDDASAKGVAAAPIQAVVRTCAHEDATPPFDVGPVDAMSQTTKELLSLIHGLSRDKQKALISRLNKFTTSEKQAADVSELEESIGDPTIWQQLTAPISELTQKQRAWEAEIEAKLQHERAEKETLLAQAEARRQHLLQQLDAEEKELQQLLAKRRTETLEKLRQVEEATRLPLPPCASPTTKPMVREGPPPTAQRSTAEPVRESVSVESAPLPPAPALVATSMTALPKETAAVMHEVRLKLLSSWGNNTRVLGLTQVSVYDMEGNEVDVPLESLKLYSGQADMRPIPKSNGMVRDLARLFNGVAYTTNENDMWLGRQIDANPLQIAFSVGVLPSKLCIWNYNSKLQAACVRDVEVFVDNQCKWSGSLPESFGAEDESACTWINVVSNMRKKAPPTAAPKPLPETPRHETAKSVASSGPIWLNAASTTKVEPIAAPTARREREIKSLDLSRVGAEPSVLRQSTSRRRLAEPKLEVEPKAEAPAPVRAMPSLQSSWDTLEHFKKTNRSRLPLEVGDTTPRHTTAIVPPLSSTELPRSFVGETPRLPVTDATLHQDRPASAIPTLPRGRTLVFEWLTTWGDPYYVGLNGIDVFTETGVLLRLAKSSDSGAFEYQRLPEYANEQDPRVAANLVDGVNYTCDDLHMWLAPFTPHQVHSVTLQLEAPTTLSMLRIWNYNKSRAHSFRGVRDTRILLDGREIFVGEVRKAPGILGAIDQCAEVVLFTTDEAVLRAIEQSDPDPTVDATPAALEPQPVIPRPSTAEAEADVRPKTAVVTSPVQVASAGGRKGRTIKLVLQTTWGDRNYVGLTGLELYVSRDGTVTSLPLALPEVGATPRDLHTLGYDGDPRTLDKLIDKTNVTCDDCHMWLVPFGGASAPEVTITLGRDVVCVGLAVWNYNKSQEDTSRGAKAVQIFVDSTLVTTTVLRKAPGHALFDFRQFVPLADGSAVANSAPIGGYKTHLVRQDYEPPLHPSGFVLKFVLWSTWGDPYYVGLNGLEIYNDRGQLLPPPAVLLADPNGLADSPHDARVIENLFCDADNNTWDASHAWLAPLASSLGQFAGNIIYAVYETPICLGMIKVFNYAKTPERGAREIEIYLDDLKLYMGSLRQAPPAPSLARTGKLQQAIEFGQPILFTLHPGLVEAEKRKLLYCGAEEQDVLCINEGQVIVESKAMYRAPDPGAEGVVVDLLQRPTTAMIRQ